MDSAIHRLYEQQGRVVFYLVCSRRSDFREGVKRCDKEKQLEGGVKALLSEFATDFTPIWTLGTGYILFGTGKLSWTFQLLVFEITEKTDFCQ